MYKSNALMGLVLMMYVLFVFFEFSGSDTISFTIDSVLLSFVTVIYIMLIRKKTLFFTLFLVCFSGSDLLGLVMNYIPFSDKDLLSDIDYYIGNSLYIISYVFLLIEVSKSLSVLHILKNYKIHLVVLTALNVYLVYVLQIIVNPHVLGNSGGYYMELIYNITMLLLLSGALLNYFYRDNKKSLYLFIGALCIVFSEVIDVAYLYIAQRSLLDFLSTTLSLLAFYFFYQQTKLSDDIEEIRMIME